MFSHFKKHYSFDSPKTCINAYLAKNTEPSKIKDMSASKIILFNIHYTDYTDSDCLIKKTQQKAKF